MIRATFITPTGPIVMVGIVEPNVERLRAGMPLDINLKDVTPPGTRITHVFINLGRTHEQTIDEMEAGGFEIPDGLRESARALDAELELRG